jgi:4-amino-4-deoxy-L-arabinose transferase-like glycosyltransferase
MAFCAAFFIFWESYHKKQKKEQSLAYFYILLFLTFGVAFLALK